MRSQGGSKRKRGDREDDSIRPSPHRPGNLDHGRQSQPQSPINIRERPDNRGRPNRRGSRGGRNSNDSFGVDDVRAPSFKAPRPTASESIPVQPLQTNSTPGPTPRYIAVKPYDYSIITRDMQEKWNEEGRESAAQSLIEFEQDEIQLMTLIQELIQAACTGAIPAKDAGQTLERIISSEVGSDGVSVSQRCLLDCVSVAFEENPSLPPELLAEFLIATGINGDILRLELDQNLLLKLGLISGRFKQMGIRKQTNTLYRQANFNLMREESEGFAKLITELFTTSGNELPTGQVIHATVERVKAMIGAFDLDVGRSLDVILDVFGSVLIRHNRFLVKLLRASPWWPQDQDQYATIPSAGDGLPRWALPESSDYQLSDHDREDLRLLAHERDSLFWPQATKQGLLAFFQVGRTRATPQAQAFAQTAPDDDIANAWIRTTGTLPPSGNRDAAQLLGFKLRFYSSSAARGSNDHLPDNLIHLSALLIKIGFISLSDLYSHIWRTDDEMPELKEQKSKEKAERDRAARPGAGVKNALAMAGALADDTLPPTVTRLRESATRSGTPSREVEPEKPVTKDASTDPIDQKVMLLKSLLAVGALPEALFILGQFPWVVDLYPELPEYIIRLLHHCVSLVYANLRPLKSRDSLSTHRPMSETDVPGVTKGQVRLTEIVPKKSLKWAGLDRNDSGDGIDYRYYWDDWNDNIPICRNVDDIFTLCRTLLPLVGVKIGQDPSLVLKLTRIGKNSLAEDASELNKKRWLDLIKRVLLPSLSLTKSNAGVVNEVFDLLSQYPITTRYLAYLEWSSGRTSRNPDIAAAFDQARAETKDILKRISKTNVKPMARSLAKIAYANPHVVITTALAQIEVYDSIAEVFVEGARYFTDLGYDVLTWALISSMSRAGRSRTQGGGMFASRWLSALSQFAGKIYKRYSMMKAGPVLQYVTEQIERGNSTDLKMLEQLVVSMAGIATDTNFNDAQLQAMGGGPLLQSQTILQLLDRRSDSKTTSKRLIKALDEHGLIAKLLLSMAQQRESCVFEDGNVPLKAIGNTYDEISRILVQYLDLIRSNLAAEDFERVIPDVSQLLIDYEIPPDLSFGIARPIIARRIAQVDRESSEEQRINGAHTTNGDVDMEDQEASEEDGEAVEHEEAALSAATPDLEMNGVLETTTTDNDHSAKVWHPVLKSIMDNLQDQLPSEIVDIIGVGFYVTFWQLSLYDISVPSNSYQDEMNRQRKKIAAITSDRSNVSASGARTREANIKQHQHVIDELLKENKHHVRAYSDSRARLNREKDLWFANKDGAYDAINRVLMEYCFLPRILSSPLDAYFSFKFAKFLHVNCTANFRTLKFYDMLLQPQRMASLFFMCTSKESDNLGRFLRELMQDLGRWQISKETYEREAFGTKRNLIGFATKVENGKPHQLFEFEKFKRILFKWHCNLFVALNKSLSSDEYMHVRNAISILRAISPVWPVVNHHGTSLQKAVEKLRNSDKEDIKVASGALLGALSRREKEWSGPDSFLGKEAQIQDEKSVMPKTESQGEEKATDPTQSGNMSGSGKPDTAEKTVKHEQPATRDNTERPRPRPAPRTSEAVRETLRPKSSNGPAVLSRPGNDTAYSDRYPPKHDTNRSHHLPPKVVQVPQHLSHANLPLKPDIDTRNGHRESPRVSSRLSTNEPPRSDSRSGYPRSGPPDRNHEPPFETGPRPPRSHERPTLLDREERSSRRDYDSRSHSERYYSERDPRTEREMRPERDHQRGPERGPERELLRPEREHGRLQHDPDRKRSDLIDERRSTPSASERNIVTQPAASGINPERAALINADTRSGMSIRGSAQDKLQGSRSNSPRREEERRHQSRHERGERPEERSEPPPRVVPPVTQMPNRAIPSGHNRDSRQHNQPPIDIRHGRLEPESPQRSSQRNDRLTEPEVPSGPRSRTQPGPRTRGIASAPTVPPTTTDRPTPTGPASHMRNGSIESPTGPKAPEGTGIHPDRIKHILPNDPPRGPQRPQQINTQLPPPSGPRNGQNAPQSGPSPISRTTPTGPQMDGVGRGRNNRNQIDALNNTLAQASGQPGRGRGNSRQNNGPLPPQMAAPGPGRSQFGQPDPNNPNGMPIQPRPSTGRRDSKDIRADIDGRSSRNQMDREVRDERRTDEPRRDDRREEQSREQRGTRQGNGDGMAPRKHPREENAHYGGFSRGGSRNVSESKRPRRGG